MQITNFIKGGNLFTLFLMSCLLLFVFVSPASADNFIVNGDFETGSFTGWDYVPTASVTGGAAYSGSYGAAISHDNYPPYQNMERIAGIYQMVDLTSVNSLEFYCAMPVYTGGGAYAWAHVWIDENTTLWESPSGASSGSFPYAYHDVDVSNYSGSHVINFGSAADTGHDPALSIVLNYDNIIATASAASPEFDDVSWDQDPYHTGETANITTNIVNFDDTTYSYYLDLSNSNDYLTTYEITSETESNYYEFPIDWTDISLLARLIRVTNPYATNEVQLDYDVSHFETTNLDTTVSFNKSSYNPGETVKVTWSGALAGSAVWLFAGDDGDKLQTDVAYSGTMYYTIPSGTEENYYVVEVITNGQSQAEASAVINIGDYWTTDDIYIDSYTVNKTTFEGQTTTVDKEESAKATLTTNINIDYIDVYYYTEEMGITITQDYDYEINGNMVNVTFPNSDHGYYYARIDVFNISTTSENRQYLFFDVGTGSKGIDIYNSKVAMMDTGEVITTESIVGYGGNDLYLPLVRTVTFDLYTDEIINSTLITSDDLEEGGLNYNFTQTYHLRRSYNFDTPGLHEIEMTVYNDETNSNDYIKWNCYVQGIDQSGLNGSVVMYWTKSEIELNGIGLLYFNVTDLPENPILEITSTTESNYETTRTLYPTQAGTETVQTNEAGVFTATMTCEGVVYAIATLTITDPTVIVEDVTEEDFSTTFDGLIASSAFIALLIIIACVGSFGKVGGAVGAVLGGIVGISISTIMEFLPWWIFFVMILALVVLFSSKVVSNIGGE